MKPQPLRKTRSFSFQVFILITVVATALAWTANHSFEDRVVTIRYLLFVLSGMVAFAMPYIIFPDNRIPIIQLGNIHGKRLLGYFLAKCRDVILPLFLFYAVVLFGDIQNPLGNITGKTAYFLMAAGLSAGLIFLALSRYLQSGSSSQFWKESERGRELRRKAADYFKFPLDPGSIPSLINTVLITFTGMVAVVISAVLYGWFGSVSEIFIGSVVLAAGGWSLYNLSNRLEQNYYQSNAFYREFFGTTLKGKEDADFRKVEQLWWVPGPLKAHVWQYLLQLDRIVPAGRVVAAGHAIVWFIAYQKPDPQVILAVWVLFALAHQFFIGLTFKNEVSPPWLLRWAGSAPIWFFTRFWMQLRWILPLAASMYLQRFIFGTPDNISQGVIILVFLAAALLASVFGTVKLKNSINA